MMKIIQSIKNKIFKKKLENIGFDMTKGSENERIATAFNEKGLGGNHFVKCMEDGIRTNNLQEICERISGRKEAGRYLQKKPLVIQCHSCQNDFSDEEGIKFAETKVIDLESLSNIIDHLTTCEGIICDCGNKVFYFDECKKCKLKWEKRSVCLRKRNQDYVTKKQKQQVKKYEKKFAISELDDGGSK